MKTLAHAPPARCPERAKQGRAWADRSEQFLLSRTSAGSRTTPAWALILAGGDRACVPSQTRQIAGDARPTQFCPLADKDTLLERTRRRVDLLIRPDRQLIAVSRPHEKYYGYLAAELPPSRLVTQPRNLDTAPGILYSLLRLVDLAGDVPVTVFPSDHWVSDERAFVSHVATAVDVVRDWPAVVVLLGMEPSSPATGYGWIDPEGALPASEHSPVFRVRSFWEKPSAARAEQLMAAGCLWNSFVMVGWVSTYLGLIAAAAPQLIMAFDPVRIALGSRDESAALEQVYAALPPMSFSRTILARRARSLVTMPVKGIEWSDVGNPAAALARSPASLISASHR